MGKIEHRKNICLICLDLNVFVKPQEQNRIYSSYALARKGRMKSNDFSPQATLFSVAEINAIGY